MRKLLKVAMAAIFKDAWTRDLGFLFNILI